MQASAEKKKYKRRRKLNTIIFFFPFLYYFFFLPKRIEKHGEKGDTERETGLRKEVTWADGEAERREGKDTVERGACEVNKGGEQAEGEGD